MINLYMINSDLKDKLIIVFLHTVYALVLNL